MQKKVTIYYLEMNSPDELTPIGNQREDVEIRQAQIPNPELSRFLYTAVGSHWLWVDRLTWDYPTWFNYLNRQEIQTWIGYLRGTPFGYFELEHQSDNSVEIVYFGIMPQFFGKGLGKFLLHETIQKAWAMQPHRVWVHTCSLDHSIALKNYQARGFKLYKTESGIQNIPNEKPELWPGANYPQQGTP